jgi:hypothetical protein
MKSKRFRLILSMLIGIFFAITIASLFGVERNTPSVWLSVHMGAGALTLVGSFLHLAVNREWIRTVLSKPVKSLPRDVRRNRDIDLGMIVSGLVVGLTGIIYALNPQLIGLERLHTLGGLIFIALTMAHMLLHGKWMRAAMRQMFGDKARKKTIEQA